MLSTVPRIKLEKGPQGRIRWLEPDDFHFHDPRHTFASRFVKEGGSLPALQQILGYARLAMTMRYSHLSPRHLRDEIEKTSRRAQARSHEPLTVEVVSANIA